MLDAIAPPYTLEFVQLVLPMVENEEITGTMRAEGENDPVSEFIGKYNNGTIIATCAFQIINFSKQILFLCVNFCYAINIFITIVQLLVHIKNMFVTSNKYLIWKFA